MWAPQKGAKPMRTMRTFLALIFVLVGTAGLVLSEDGPRPTRMLSPYFFIEGENPGIDSFPLKSTDVVANISGVIADVTVTQVYENHGTGPIHGRYVFPGSTRAAVHGMSIRVGDKAVVAKIRERQKAAQEFEEAKAAGKNAALLEQQRPNVFTMAIANIMPGDRVEVQLIYSEMLTPEKGMYEFVYPTVVGPRYSHTPEAAAPEDSKWVKSPYLHEGESSPATFSIHVNVSGGVPVAELGSPSHEAKIAWEGLSLAHVSLDNDAGNRDFILNYRLSGRQIQSGLMIFESERENFFLLTVQPPERVAARDIPPREYIFVLDVSGSMHGFPLDTAKRVIENLVGNLKPTDTFNVVLFSGASRVLSPVSLAANPQNVARALTVIAGERGGGGTELEAALRTALKLPRSSFVSRTVVVITDGFIAEEAGAFQLIHENLNNTNIFAFGIGGSVNRYLIEGIARAGQGEPFVVVGPQEAVAAGERFREYIESPVLINVRVSYHNFDAYDVEPESQPDLFAERPVVLFGKWRGPKQGQIEVTGRTANGNFTKVFDLTDSATRQEHAALPQLWARSRIARLSDFSFTRDDPEAIREVTTLGLTYSLLTRHTSFIAVLEQVRNPSGQGTDVNQPLPLPNGVSDLAVGYGSGAEPGFWILLFGAAALVAIATRRRVRSC
jgi:Ca-activated chloride channel homolog